VKGRRNRKGREEGRRGKGREMRYNLVKTANELAKNLCNHLICGYQ
jgi:hypothetical protein